MLLTPWLVNMPSLSIGLWVTRGPHTVLEGHNTIVPFRGIVAYFDT
jgi:hypothetical protein